MANKDSLRVLQAAGNELHTAIVKATNHDELPPKPKHVQTVKAAAADRTQLLAELFDYMSERYNTKSWAVAYKALIVTHEIMREKESRAMKFLALSPHLLNMSSFRERCNLDGLSHSTGIQKYAEYLEEKAATFKEAHVDFVREGLEKANKLTAKNDPEALLRLLNLVLRQMNNLLECKYTKRDLNNVVVAEVYKLLVKDLLRLYHSLNEGVINVLEFYFNFPKDVAKDALAVYKAFLKATDDVMQFLDVGRGHEATDGINIPTLKTPPATLVASLQAYVDGRLPAAAQDLPPILHLNLSSGDKKDSDDGLTDAFNPPATQKTTNLSNAPATATTTSFPKPASFDDFDAFASARSSNSPALQQRPSPATTQAIPQQQQQQPQQKPKAQEIDLLSFDDPPPAVEVKKAAILAVASGTPMQPSMQQQFAAFGMAPTPTPVMAGFNQPFGMAQPMPMGTQPMYGQMYPQGGYAPQPGGGNFAAFGAPIPPQQNTWAAPPAMFPAQTMNASTAPMGFGASATNPFAQPHPFGQPAAMPPPSSNPFAAPQAAPFGAPAAPSTLSKTNPFA